MISFMLREYLLLISFNLIIKLIQQGVSQFLKQIDRAQIQVLRAGERIKR